MKHVHVSAINAAMLDTSEGVSVSITIGSQDSTENGNTIIISMKE